MRFLAVMFFTLLLAACRTAPVQRSETGTMSSVDSVREFLITSAATDFHVHPPADSLRFREVRLGHIVGENGEKTYMLCGQFLPVREGKKSEWTPFATIKTSGYEQHLGGQSVNFCRDSSVVWDDMSDLSPALRSRFDHLR